MTDPGERQLMCLEVQRLGFGKDGVVKPFPKNCVVAMNEITIVESLPTLPSVIVFQRIPACCEDGKWNAST
jgi:hypothetical protein